MKIKSKSTKITSFDSATADTVMREVESALQQIASKHGLVLQPWGRAKYSSSNGELTFGHKLLVLANEEGESPQKAHFMANCQFYGLPPAIFERPFTYRLHTWRVVGLRPNRKKYPVLCRNENGKELLYPVDIIKMAHGLR